MGLFGGLFGSKSKEPKEEKNYSKALKDAIKKPNEKNIAALTAALESYPAGWQGWWLCGVYHDQGMNGASVDPAKANMYFAKAQDAVRGTEHEVWMEEFMYWYPKPAGNYNWSMRPELLRARRLGIALCRCILLGENIITAPFENYGADNYYLNGLLGHTDADYSEMEAFDYLTVSSIDRDSQIKDTNRFIKRSEKAVDVYAAAVKATTEGREANWEDLYDLFDYMMGFNALHGGRLLTAELAENAGESETRYGIRKIIAAVFSGCQPALHELAQLALASEKNHEIVESVFVSEYRKIASIYSLDGFIHEHLKRSAAQGDAEAERLDKLYFEA